MGRRTILQAQVSAAGQPVPDGRVDVTVDGVGAGASRLDARGTAKVLYSTFIAGQHTILARYSGTKAFAASVSDPVRLAVSQK